jgi:hypothetical protein
MSLFKGLVLTLFLFPVISSAQVCGPDGPVKSQATEAMKLIYQPANMIGSCVTTSAKGITNWRDSLDAQVGEFLKQDHIDDLAPALAANNLTNADVVQTQTDGYLKASENYQKLIASYPDKKGMKASDYTDIGHILDAKDISKKEKNRAFNELNHLIGVMSDEQGKWGESYLNQTASLMANDSLKQRIVEQAKKKFCVSGVKLDVIPGAGLTTELLKASAGDVDQALAKLNSRLQKTESNPDQVWFCSKAVPMRSALYEVSGLVSFDIPKDSFFADNQSSLDELKITALKNKLKQQLASPPGCTRTVKSVQIETSSNAKANSDAVGRWDFASLSAKRAEYLKSQVAQMFAEEKSNKNFVKMNDFAAITRVNSAGSNGDGTSGPCPYREVVQANGRRLIEKDPAVWNAPEMESSKYARISFEIQDEGLSCRHGPDYQSLKTQPYVGSQCFAVAISCK